MTASPEGNVICICDMNKRILLERILLFIERQFQRDAFGFLLAFELFPLALAEHLNKSVMFAFLAAFLFVRDRREKGLDVVP